MDKNSVVICLPIEGDPFIVMKDKKPTFEDLESVVAVDESTMIEEIHVAKPCGINTMFLDNKKWAFMNKLLQKHRRNVNLFVNEEGLYKCTPNFGLILLEHCGMRPAHGNVVVVAKKKDLLKMKRDYASFLAKK